MWWKFFTACFLSALFLEFDVAAISIDIHWRAGSCWHLIQDFTNIACNIHCAFLIHQNEGMFQKLFVLWPFGLVLCKAQVDKVDETWGEFPFLWVTQLWWVSFYYLRQLVKHTVPFGVGESPCGQLIQCNPQAPDVWADVIALPGCAGIYPFRRHVRPAPCISCFGNGVHKLSTNAKVTEFNISISVQKNIGRFDISVNDFQVFF